jgi:nucleotide-binding universal stress UspA family protein
MTLRLEGRSVSGDQFRAACARVLFLAGAFSIDAECRRYRVALSTTPKNRKRCVSNRQRVCTMYENILLPTDGSDATETVLDHTVDIATTRDATVHVLYVVDDRALLTLTDEMKSDVLDGLRDEGQQAVEETAAALDEAGIDNTTALVRGKPAEEITDYVDANGIDLVTMGTRGDDHETNMLGSTSRRVVSESPAPVLTLNVTEQ